jgi:lipocalin-like protein
MVVTRWIQAGILVAAGAATLAQSEARGTAGGLVGTWQLESRRDRTAGGTTAIEPSLGENPLGLLIYDAAGRVAVQLMKRDRVSTSGSPSPRTSAGSNSSGGTGDYDAYFGTYEVDVAAGTVTHHLEAALAPSDVGRTLTRRFSLEGDRLTLSFKTTVADHGEVTRIIVWRRVG